jgi:hypothetical protein
VHSSSRDDEYGKPFGPGDIIGCYLFLDDQNPLTNQIRFFKNGKDQGIAYNGKELPSGVYFPAISLYMKVSDCCHLIAFDFFVCLITYYCHTLLLLCNTAKPVLRYIVRNRVSLKRGLVRMTFHWIIKLLSKP